MSPVSVLTLSTVTPLHHSLTIWPCYHSQWTLHLAFICKQPDWDWDLISWFCRQLLLVPSQSYSDITCCGNQTHPSQSVTLIKHPAEQNLVFCDMKAKFLSGASDAGVTHSECRSNTLPSSSAWFDVFPAVWGEQWQWSGDDIIWTSSSLPHQSTCHHPTKHWLNLSHINTSPTHFSSQICLINAGLLHTTWHNSDNKNHFYISSTCLHKILKQ